MTDVPDEGKQSADDPAAMSMGARVIATTHVFEEGEDLVVALAALDPRAWRQLFEEQYQRVYNYALVRTGNLADADDIAATVFVEAVKGIRGFNYRGTPVAAWLFRIAHNETVDLLKRRRRTQTESIDVAEASRQLATTDASEVADEWRAVREGIGMLKPEHRNVLMLRLVEGRSVAEVATLLGKSQGAVKVTQMRALQSLRATLGKSG